MFRALRPRCSRAEFERDLKALLPELYRVARGLTGNREGAEDLAHDVCVKAIAGFDRAQLANTAACRAWLHRILLNDFRDRYRRDKRSPIDAHAELDNVIEFSPSGDAGPATEYQRELFRHRLDASLQSLSVDVRFATVMHLVRGIPYKEIAQIVDCPIGTVMSRIAKGRRVLREQLTEFRGQVSNEDSVARTGVDA